MGIRGELFSLKLVCDERTYFFNVKENRLGDLFLTIVESKENELNTYERHSVVVFKENLDEFMSQLSKATETMKTIKPAQYAKKIPHKTSSDTTKATSSATQNKKHMVRIKKTFEQSHEHKKVSPKAISVVSVHPSQVNDDPSSLQKQSIPEIPPETQE